MKKILFSAMAIAMFGIFSGCSKDDDDDDNQNCELNVGELPGSFKITAVSYKADDATPAVDQFATWDDCQKDNVFTLVDNYQASVTDGGLVCTPPEDGTGSWGFDSGSSQLIFSIGVRNYGGTVGNFNCSGMTVTRTGPGAGEVTVITFVRQ